MAMLGELMMNGSLSSCNNIVQFSLCSCSVCVCSVCVCVCVCACSVCVCVFGRYVVT